jgi:phage gp36-like protein
MYCTEADLRGMIKSDVLGLLISGAETGTPEENQAKIGEIILQAIEDAGAEIDGYLAKLYTVPLVRVPQVIVKYAKDIAAYNLITRIGVGKDDDREQNYYKRYQAALRFLELVAKGTVGLGLNPPTAQAAGGFRMDGPRRVFTRKNLKGM